MGHTETACAPDTVPLLDYGSGRSGRRVWLPRPVEGAVSGALACLVLVALVACLSFQAASWHRTDDDALMATAPVVCGTTILLSIAYFRFRSASSIVGAILGVTLAAAAAAGGFFAADEFNSSDDRLLFIAPVAFAAPVAAAGYALWLRYRWRGLLLGVVFGIVSGTAACAVLAPRWDCCSSSSNRS